VQLRAELLHGTAGTVRVEIPSDTTLPKSLSVAGSNGCPDQAPVAWLAEPIALGHCLKRSRFVQKHQGQDSKDSQNGNVDVSHRANAFLLVTLGYLRPHCAKIG
jgi:hypothetical protein